MRTSVTPTRSRDPLDDFSPVKMHDDRRGSLFVPPDQAPSGVKVDDVVLIGGRRAQVTAIEPRLIEVTYRFTWL